MKRQTESHSHAYLFSPSNRGISPDLAQRLSCAAIITDDFNSVDWIPGRLRHEYTLRGSSLLIMIQIALYLKRIYC